MIILGFDALDFDVVEKFGCENLLQACSGKTDIGGFALERTVVLWASLMTGKNMESQIPIETQWEFKLPKEETFFKYFDVIETVDLPAFSLKLKNHKREHELLAGYFKEKNSIEEFDEIVWKNHEENKKDFLKIMDNFASHEQPKILFGYFDLADAIGHLSFGIEKKMVEVYEELDTFTSNVTKSTDDVVMIVSDHGMKPVGRFGDHTKHGFYSFNKKVDIKHEPKITEFFDIVKSYGRSDEKQ